ncbi:MAG: hypothetical protein KAX36_10835 [Thermoflexales bacterium]|nr:hypothetical protein [Thermoflexales bacterium]
MTEVMKTCTKCGVAKGLECFHRQAKGKYGLRPDCKPCHIDDVRNYIATHRESVNKRLNEWEKNNREKRRQIVKKSNEKRLDQIRDRDRKYRAINAERIREQARARYKSDKSKVKRGNARQVAELSDAYVSNLIANNNFSAKLVPKELIEIHRVHLKIKRLLRQRKQA